MSALILALTAGAVVGLTPVAATTASLVIVVVTSAAALSAHARDGHVRWRTGLLFAAAGAVPAMLGGALAARLPGALLTAAFALVAGAAAVRMLRRRGPADEDVPVRPVRAAAAGAGLGGITGVLGVGGGFLAVPALVGVLGLRTRVAVGTGLVVVTANALAALTQRAGTIDTLDWTVLGPFAGAAVLGAWDGGRLSAKVSGEALQRVFAVLLLAVAVFMLIDAVV